MGYLDEQLNAHLRDAHAIEQLGLAQMRAAPELAGDPALATAFRQHLVETEHHEELTRDRLEARGVSPFRLQNAILGGNGAYVLFVASQPDTPGKLVAFAYAIEFLEVAGYEQLKRVARGGDREAERLAEHILTDEREMAGRLSDSFDAALDAWLVPHEVLA